MICCLSLRRPDLMTDNCIFIDFFFIIKIWDYDNRLSKKNLMKWWPQIWSQCIAFDEKEDARDGICCVSPASGTTCYPGARANHELGTLFRTLRKPQDKPGAEAQREEGTVATNGERGEDAHEQGKSRHRCGSARETKIATEGASSKTSQTRRRGSPDRWGRPADRRQKRCGVNACATAHRHSHPASSGWGFTKCRETSKCVWFA